MRKSHSLDLASEPTEVEVAITVPSLKSKKLAPDERSFLERLVRPYPDPIIDVDVLGAKLVAKIVITFPNGIIRETEIVLEGKSSVPYTRIVLLSAEENQHSLEQEQQT